VDDGASWDAGSEYREALEATEQLYDRRRELDGRIAVLPRRHRRHRGVRAFRVLVDDLNVDTLLRTLSTPYGDVVEPDPSWVERSERLEGRLDIFERNLHVLVAAVNESADRLEENLRALLTVVDEDGPMSAPPDRPEIGEPPGWPVVAFPVQRHAPPMPQAQHHGPAAKVAA